MGDGGAGRADELELARAEVDAVGEQRPGAERARLGEPLDRAGVDPVLGRVHVQRPELGAGGERLVGEREGGVGADERARQRRPLPGDPAQEAAVLGEPGPRPRGAVAVGGLVAEHRAGAEPAERLLDHVERAVDRVRRGVVVDERRRPGEQRLDPADERGGADRVLVERPVEPPPDPLQDLEEALGRRERVGHAAGERRVEVRVRADVARDDEAAGAVPPLAPPCIPDGRAAPSL